MRNRAPIFLFALGALAQTPAPDAVVAKIGTKPVTAADANRIMARLPADLKKAFLQNPKNALQSIALIDFLSTEAEKSKAGDTSPFKEQLEWQRRQILAQAEAARRQAQFAVNDEEMRKRYEGGKSNFDTAKIRIIQVSFTDEKAPKPVTEAEAKATADAVVKEARAGADFGDLVQKYSDDKKAKEGGFVLVRRTDTFPEDIKKAIFSTPAGGIAEPVKQGLGFYVIKVDEVTTQKFEDVRDQIASTIRQERFQQWMQGVQKQFEVTIESPGFFNPPTPAASQSGGK
jgi:parvulin-like peptidyl-prolyl isomerase